LAARKKIQELQESTSTDETGDEEKEPKDKDEVKKAITKLGIENGLASKYTSFVGVDKTTGKAVEDQPMSTREIKDQVASGFGMSFGGSYNAMGGMIEKACAPSRSKMKCGKLRLYIL
jgi:hypothetical protein